MRAFVLLALAAPAAAAPVEIPVGIHINSVRSVDLKAGTFLADFYLWLRYPRTGDAASDSEMERVEFVNGNLTSFEVNDKKQIGADNYLVWRARGAFFFHPELRRYPFDRQELPIRIEHPSLLSSDLRYADDLTSYQRSRLPQERWGLGDDVAVPEYEIHQLGREVGEAVYATDFGDTTLAEPLSTYSRFTFRLDIARRAAAYLAKILIPLFVILGIAYLVFWLPAEELKISGSVIVTALVSCVAFHFTVSSNLPQVGYVVLSDKFFFLCYSLIFLAMLQTVWTYNLVRSGKSAQAIYMEVTARWLYPTLTALGMIFLVTDALLQG